MSPQVDESNDDLVEILAAMIAGAVAGGATSSNPFIGAIIGGGSEAAVEALKVAGHSVRQYFGNREARRLSIAAQSMIAAHARKLSQGLHYRDDWHVGEGSPAEEIVEQTLRMVVAETQEKKVSFESVIPVEIAFDRSINFETAFRYISLAAGLSYLELKTLFALTSENEWTFRSYDRGDSAEDPYFDAVLSLLYKNVLYPAGITDRYGGPFLNRINLSPTGQGLARVMQLERLPEEEVRQVIDALMARKTRPHPS